MQKKTQKLDLKIQEISSSYKELIKTEFYVVKKNLIDTIRKLCSQALDIIDNDNVSPQNLRKRRQVQDMLKRTNQIQQKIDEQEKTNPSIGSKSSNPRLAFSKHNKNQNTAQHQDDNEYPTMDPQALRQKSKYAARSMIFHELNSQHINITTQELDKLAARIQTNHEVMKEMEQLVLEQGGNLQKVQENIKKTYENVVQANNELDGAKKQQNRYFKLRMKLAGVLGGLGYAILGLPGLIFGFFSGLMATS